MEKRDLKYLVISFGSIIFVSSILPIIDSLANMAISAINRKVNKWALDMELDKREAETIAPTGSITNAIGFAIPNESEEDEEW